MAGAGRARRWPTAPSASRPACSTCRAPTPRRDEIVALATSRRQVRRRLRLAHAQRGHRDRGGGGRDAARSARRPACGADLAPEDRRAEPLGREREGAGADRRGPRARACGSMADQYLYDAASSNLGIRFPSWALEGGQPKINKRLDDAATWARIKEEMQQADSRARPRELQLRARRHLPSRSVAERPHRSRRCAQKLTGPERPRRAVRDDAA